MGRDWSAYLKVPRTRARDVRDAGLDGHSRGPGEANGEHVLGRAKHLCRNEEKPHGGRGLVRDERRGRLTCGRSSCRVGGGGANGGCSGRAEEGRRCAASARRPGKRRRAEQRRESHSRGNESSR